MLWLVISNHSQTMLTNQPYWIIYDRISSSPIVTTTIWWWKQEFTSTYSHKFLHKVVLIHAILQVFFFKIFKPKDYKLQKERVDRNLWVGWHLKPLDVWYALMTSDTSQYFYKYSFQQHKPQTNGLHHNCHLYSQSVISRCHLNLNDGKKSRGGSLGIVFLLV